MGLDCYDAINLEQKTHSENSMNQYYPYYRFGGYMECFNHINDLDFFNTVCTFIDYDFEYYSNIKL